MPCPNEHILIPMQNAGQWATTTDPITEEHIWVRASDAYEVAEQLVARAVAGDPALQLDSYPRPVEVAFAHWLLRLDAKLWTMFTAPFRRLRRRTVRPAQ